MQTTNSKRPLVNLFILWKVFTWLNKVKKKYFDGENSFKCSCHTNKSALASQTATDVSKKIQGLMYTSRKSVHFGRAWGCLDSRIEIVKRGQELVMMAGRDWAKVFTYLYNFLF